MTPRPRGSSLIPHPSSLQAGFISLAMGPMVYLVIGMAIVGTLGAIAWGIYSKGHAAGAAEIREQWHQAAAAQRKKEETRAAAAATRLETANEKARVVYRTITQQVDRYIDRPVYRNVCLDADGLRDANAALRGGPPPDPAQPHKPLPGSHPALRWDRGERLAQADRGR